ncbi:hypothetical protein BT69DRAFT_1237575 [Atractiella rhizophila]|nr:hypothetical protein BT69DRAFT_1237575 [Atractiella rhizophila]
MSNINNLLPILHHCDGLCRSFSQSHAAQYQYVRSISSSLQQLSHLRKLARTHPNNPMSSSTLRLNASQRLQTNVNECLAGLRDELKKMEVISESLDKLLFEVEILLAEPGTRDTFGLNPEQTTKRVGAVAGGVKEELLRRRELLADMPWDEDDEQEDIVGMQEWESNWAQMLEYDRVEKEEMDELTDVLASTIKSQHVNEERDKMDMS